MKKHCQRINGRAVKRGPYPQPMRERWDVVYPTAKAQADALWRHGWFRRWLLKLAVTA